MSDFSSAIIGAVIALAGAAGVKIWDQTRETRALRKSLRAEIAGTLAIAQDRKHHEKAEAILGLWKSGNDISINYYGSDLANSPVFEANVSRIGLLGPDLARDVVVFYTRLQAIRITLRAFEEGRFATSALPYRIGQLEEALGIWLAAKGSAEGLIKRL